MPRAIWRTLTSYARCLPDFLIIGGQRAGTTSLYSYMVSHPFVLPASTKEVHFFDNNFRRGTWWYRGHFPSEIYRKYLSQARNHAVITGEASPYYIFHPHVPSRILSVVPNVKIIILLRNPVDRAYSHYHLEVMIGAESLSFEGAIDREQERLHGEWEKMHEDEYYYSFNHQHYSYLSRGIYVDQITLWMNVFAKDQVLILKSEDFYADSGKVVREVLEFLDMPRWKSREFRKFNEGHYSEMDGKMRKRLKNYFEAHNQRLYAYLGKDLGWEK